MFSLRSRVTSTACAFALANALLHGCGSHMGVHVQSCAALGLKLRAIYDAEGRNRCTKDYAKAQNYEYDGQGYDGQGLCMWEAYAILGISERQLLRAETDEDAQNVVKRVFRKLSLEVHPDKTSDLPEVERLRCTEKFQALKAAHEIFSRSRNNQAWFKILQIRNLRGVNPEVFFWPHAEKAWEALTTCVASTVSKCAPSRPGNAPASDLLALEYHERVQPTGKRSIAAGQSPDSVVTSGQDVADPLI